MMMEKKPLVYSNVSVAGAITVIALIGAVVAAGAFFSGPFFALDFSWVEWRGIPSRSTGVELDADLDQYLARQEAAALANRAETQKKILWFDPHAKAQSEVAFVYLHGFSATRAEISPVVEDLAAQYKANVFFTRLTAHGLTDGEAFAYVKASDWIADAEEALAIGQRIGKKIILIGTSTGATLATWLAARHPDKILGVVLLSANYALPDARVKYLSGPLGPFWAKLLIGEYRQFPADNPDHAKFWTTRYRSQGIVALMDLLNSVKYINWQQLKVPVLFLYTHEDKVVSVPELQLRYQQWGVASNVRKKLIDVSGANRHELVGRILAPQTVQTVEQEIKDFFPPNGEVH